MQARVFLALVASGIALAACIPSVNPFYTPRDVTYAPELLGTWTEGTSEGADSWNFARRDDGDGYTLTLDSDGDHGVFDATLFALGETRFLDIIASKVDFADDQLDVVNKSVFPGHLVLHVAAIEPELELAFMDGDWLENYLDDNPKALSHRREHDDLLLTGSTRELQRFLRRHVDDGKLFSDYGELTRTSENDGV